MSPTCASYHVSSSGGTERMGYTVRCYCNIRMDPRSLNLGLRHDSWWDVELPSLVSNSCSAMDTVDCRNKRLHDGVICPRRAVQRHNRSSVRHRRRHAPRLNPGGILADQTNRHPSLGAAQHTTPHPSPSSLPPTQPCS